MKTAPLAALLMSAATAFAAAFAAASAFASDAAAPAAAPQVQVSANVPRTRAEVKAELAEARASGALSENPNAPDYPPQFATGGYTVPRAQIPAHRAAASAAGLALN